MEEHKLNLRKNPNVKEDSPYLDVEVYNKLGHKKFISMHSYLIGLMLGAKAKAQNKLAFNCIVIGNLGSGKSTLVQGLAGVRAAIDNKQIDWNHITWGAEDFAIKYHQEEGTPLIFDESIDGMKLNTSTQGELFKKALVTGRFRLRTSFFLTDELQEYHPKLVRMTDCLIRVRNYGFLRGYVEIYTDKRKIDFIYNGMKYFNKTWESREIKNINPDCKCKFKDFTNIFYSESEYNNKKLEFTKVEDTKINISWKPEKLKAFISWNNGLKLVDIAKELNINSSTLRGWVGEFKEVVRP